MVKNPPANAGDITDTDLIPGLGRSPGVGYGNPFQYSCLENSMDRGASHRQRSLVGYSSQGCKKLDTTKVTQHAQLTGIWVISVFVVVVVVVVVVIKSQVQWNFLFMFSVAHMQEVFQRSCSQSMVSASDHLGTCQKCTILTSPPDLLNKKCWERAPVISFNKPSQMC